MANDWKILHIQNRETLCLQFQLGRMQRHDTQPHPRLYCLLDRLAGIRFHPPVNGNMMRRKKTFHRTARARTGLTHEESFPLQPFYGNTALFAQGVIRGSNDHQWIFHKRFRGDIQIIRWLPHDGHIDHIVG